MLIVALFRFIRTELFVLLPIIYIMVTTSAYCMHKVTIENRKNKR